MSDPILRERKGMHMTKTMFDNIGWIVEAQIKDRKRDEFEAVMKEVML